MFYKENITNNKESFYVVIKHLSTKIKLIKKQIVNFALIAAMIGSIGDTTKKDITKITPPSPTKIDTMKKDTTHH